MLDEMTGRFLCNNRYINLSDHENLVLEYLILHKNRSVPITELSLYLYNSKRKTNNIKVLIHILTRKLKGVLLITGKHKCGYTMTYIGD